MERAHSPSDFLHDHNGTVVILAFEMSIFKIVVSKAIVIMDTGALLFSLYDNYSFAVSEFVRKEKGHLIGEKRPEKTRK